MGFRGDFQGWVAFDAGVVVVCGDGGSHGLNGRVRVLKGCNCVHLCFWLGDEQASIRDCNHNAPHLA